MTAEITVRDNPEARTYDALADGETVGTLIYEPEGSRLVFRHTIVDPEYRGEGVGTELVRGALDDVRARGLTITNYCSFVSEFIDAHPEYADLIDAAHPGHVIRPEPRR
jgi:hypothetical protein